VYEERKAGIGLLNELSSNGSLLFNLLDQPDRDPLIPPPPQPQGLVNRTAAAIAEHLDDQDELRHFFNNVLAPNPALLINDDDDEEDSSNDDDDEGQDPQAEAADASDQGRAGTSLSFPSRNHLVDVNETPMKSLPRPRRISEPLTSSSGHPFLRPPPSARRSSWAAGSGTTSDPSAPNIIFDDNDDAEDAPDVDDDGSKDSTNSSGADNVAESNNGNASTQEAEDLDGHQGAGTGVGGAEAAVQPPPQRNTAKRRPEGSFPSRISPRLMSRSRFPDTYYYWHLYWLIGAKFLSIVMTDSQWLECSSSSFA